jgi:tetraacyldisaccharide 4'-kinase
MGRIMARVWKGKAPVARAFLFLPLSLLSCIYCGALIVRDVLYRSGVLRVQRVSIPVVSVGNISMGGTGKTTIVEKLCRELQDRGFRPGIITRGYRRKKGGTFVVDPRTDNAESAGDEAFMLARRTMLPVIVGTNRARAIACGIEESGIDVAVLDDGFQVRDLYKDVEVLVTNGKEHDNALHLFPLGFLREPLEAARRADVLIVNKGGEVNDRMKPYASAVPVFHMTYRPLHLHNIKRAAVVDFRAMDGKKVIGFAGLGDNSAFFALLRRLGADLVRTVEFEDHHRYDEGDMRRLASFDDAQMVVTTEKDAVKLDRGLARDSLFYLAVEAQIEEEHALVDMVQNKVRR